MRVVVNLDLCEGNALCMGAVPEVFDVDDVCDKAVLLDDQPPDELRPRLMEAVISIIFRFSKRESARTRRTSSSPSITGIQ